MNVLLAPSVNSVAKMAVKAHVGSPSSAHCRTLTWVATRISRIGSATANPKRMREYHDKDAQGQEISGATAEAWRCMIGRCELSISGTATPAGLFDAAREVSPSFTMAHLAKAWLFDSKRPDHA